MYRNARKLSLSVCIWAGIACTLLLPAVTLWGISFDESVYESVSNPVTYRIAYIFLAIVFSTPFIIFLIQLFHAATIQRISDLFTADADGFVPVSELAKGMGMPEKMLIKKATRAIRKGTLVNCNYSVSKRAFLLSDKIGKNYENGGGIPENKPFVGVNCPSCAASLKIRANTVGICPFCGKQLIAQYSPEQIK